jgi:hypothetical protein
MVRHLRTVTLFAVLLAGARLLAADRVTMTGALSDEICGARHVMKNTQPPDCTHECIKHGADYVLVVKDKVYTIKPDNTAAEADLDKYAGQNVTITAEPEADFFWVLTVAPAK